MACTAAAHHMRHVDHFESRCIHRYEECGKSVIFIRIRIGYCDNVCELAAVGVGDQGLLAV